MEASSRPSRGSGPGARPALGQWRRAAPAAALAAALAVPSFASEPFSHAALDTVLERHLRDGLVDYGDLARDPGPLHRYLEACAAARPDEWPREEQIAFWVNAYNARVLDGVIRHRRLKSVLDVGRIFGIPTFAFFRERRVTAGEKLSLGDIEHRILRGRFEEPRVHFVLNCASASCPVLPERALDGATLESDLEQATARFLTDPRRNRIDPARVLEVSEIFKWFGDDFRQSSGSLQGFIESHWPDADAFQPDLPVRFLKYDWSLNGEW